MPGTHAQQRDAAAAGGEGATWAANLSGTGRGAVGQKLAAGSGSVRCCFEKTSSNAFLVKQG